MKNITIQAYEYNELNGQAKEKAYNKMYDFMIDFINDCFYDDTIDDLRDRFGNSDLKIQYDLSACQGAGVNIYGNFDLRDFMPHYQASEKDKRTIAFYIDILRKYCCFDALKIKLSQNNGEKVFDISDDDIQDFCNGNEIVFDARGRII